MTGHDRCAGGRRRRSRHVLDALLTADDTLLGLGRRRALDEGQEEVTTQLLVDVTLQVRVEQQPEAGVVDRLRANSSRLENTE